jgi:hypothetical protein
LSGFEKVIMDASVAIQSIAVLASLCRDGFPRIAADTTKKLRLQKVLVGEMHE